MPVNVAPETFTVRDGMIVSTGKPTGVMRTDRQYENFVLELEWRHLQPGGNAGLFVWSDALPAVGVPFTRSFEVQILDGRDGPNYTSHGDVFGIWGATMTPDRPHPAGWMRCLPSEKRARPSPRVEPLPRHLPGRRAQARGQRQGGLRRQPLRPAQGLYLPRVRGLGMPLPQHPHPGASLHQRGTRPRRRALDDGFISLYSGLDLRGWRSDPGHAGHWRAHDSILDYDGKSTAQDKDLWTEKDLRRLRADRRLAAARQAGAATTPGRPAQRRRREERRRLRQDTRDPLRRRQRDPAPRQPTRPRSTSPATRSARASCMATGWTRRCPPRSAPAPSPRSRPTRRPASGTGS